MILKMQQEQNNTGEIEPETQLLEQDLLVQET